MMKKIFFTLAFLAFLVSSAQIKPNFDGVNYTPLTTVEINALTGMLEGDLQYNETTKTMFLYNGSAWVDTGVAIIPDGSITEAKLNTTTNASLDLADSSVQPADLNDYVDKTSKETIGGEKTFTSKMFLGNTLSDFNIFSMRYVSATPNLGSVQAGHGSLYFQNDGRFTVNNGNTTAQTATFDLSALTQRRDYDLPNTSGTIALTSDITGISSLVEDTSPRLGGSLLTNGSNIVVEAADNITINGTLSGSGSFNLQNGDVTLPGNLTAVNSQTIISGATDPTGQASIGFSTSGGAKYLTATASDLTYDGTSLLGGGSSLPVDDTTSLVQDPVDNTKQVRIDAGAITTATTRTLTMPDADVDLGNLGAANLDLTATFDWTGIHNFTNSVDIGDYGLITGEDLGVSGRRWWLRKGAVSENFEFLYQVSDQTTAGGSYTTIYTLDETGVPTVSTDLIDKAYADANYGGGTDDQTASEVNITDSSGYYTGTTVEAALQEVGDSLLVQISSDTTGLANSSVKPIKALYVHDYSINPTEPTLPENTYGFQINGPSEEKSFVIPLGAVGADIATGTFVNFVPVHDAITITRVEAHLNTAPTGSVATFDINEDGTSILSTKLTIDATENWSDTAATAAVISDSAINALSVLSVDIDGVGSTTAGTDGTVTIYYTIDP